MKSSEPAPRAYRSALREEQAEQTKQRIARAARRRFIESGWAGTSVRSVAADAGVSEATVYAVYGTKAGLATSLVESGEMDAGVEQVAREIEAAQGDPAAQLAAFIRFDRRLFERGGDGLRLTVEGGRNEPALAMAYEQGRARGDASRRRVFAAWPGDVLRDGVTLDRALDVYAVVCSIQAFDIATRERGWSVDQVEQWWVETLTELLLG
ncbi:TetR/AcrR family transcriptional regulator [Terrabacter sp. Soil810]|uniref:TetR/AcrR family transcriptional regulator n=1 Tax=Terrabacter sp. Soil810 TaxID=1736418 RepID=UPI00070A5CA9|nr:TetR/AcrR family transcriptional regulator [Terrabacter sp. Soil810]KRF46706.1 TetR family transcriptional regulator [Terrabacter sp. Soil810]